MTTILKSTTLALITFSLPACGGIAIGAPDSSSSTSSSTTDGMDSDSAEPTGSHLVPMHFNCYNESNYQVNAAGQSVDFELMNTCVLIDDSGWMSEENMANILDGCTAACQKALGGWQNHCVNEGWKSFAPTGYACNPADYGPEYGGDILWLDGVRSMDRQVQCDLRTTCGEMFGTDVAERLQDRTDLADEPSGAQLHSDLQLRVDDGHGGPLDLAGTIGFSTTRCGETACPFYLGDVELLQTSADWRMVLDLGEFGRIDKQVSNMQVRLAKPVLGISLTDGQVAFPAEALTFRVDVEIAGAAHPLLENGAQSFLVRNPTAVLGRLDHGSLTLEVDVPTGFGSVRVATRRAD